MGKKVFIARGRGGWCHIYENRPVTYDCGVWYVSVGGKCKEFDAETANMLGIPFPKPGEMIEWPPPPSQISASEPEPEQGPPQIEKVCGTCKWDYKVRPQGTEKDKHCTTCIYLSNWEPRELKETGKMVDEGNHAQAEKLVPITDLAQLNVGDMVRNNAGNDHAVLALAGGIVALSYEGEPGTFETWWTMTELEEMGFKQVATAPRTLSRETPLICVRRWTGSAPRTLSREEARKAIEQGDTVRLIGEYIWYRFGEEARMLISGCGDSTRWSANRHFFDLPEGRYEIVKGGK